MKIIQKHQIMISEPICWLSNLCKVKQEHLESIPVQLIAFLDHNVPQSDFLRILTKSICEITYFQTAADSATYAMSKRTI